MVLPAEDGVELKDRVEIEVGVVLENTVFMVNPASGGGRGERRWRRLQSEFPALSTARVIKGGSAEQAARLLRQEVEAGDVERVISVGGDGTAHLVANTLLSIAEPSPVALGLVPAGTGSDLARHLALPRHRSRALRHALTVEPRPFDAIALRTDDGRARYSINIASGGLSGTVVEALSGNPRRGQLSYLQATMTALMGYRSFSCRVLVDSEEVYDQGLFLVAIANGEFFGKGMRVAPRADTGDGQLDVVIVPPVERWKFPWRLPQFLLGRHLGWPGVVHRRARRIRLEPSTDFPPYELDGEFFATAAMDLEVCPGALQMLV